MGFDASFGPEGKTFAVDTSAWVQVVTQSDVATPAYRIRCTAGGYLQYFPVLASGVAPDTGAPVAPVVGTPGSNVIGMATGGVETFTLPPNAWFRASTAGTFEISAGQGL